MSCGVDLRHGLDLVLLWLWYRPAAAALIQPLAWEPPYAAGAALKRPKKKPKIKKQKPIHFEWDCITSHVPFPPILYN